MNFFACKTNGRVENVVDVVRNAVVSEMSVCVRDGAAAITPERQAVVRALVAGYLQLTDLERKMFFLTIPCPIELPPVKNTNFGARAEIQQTAAWIKTHLEQDHQVSIRKRDVYDQYLKFCQSCKLKSISTADFGKVMKQVFPSVRPRRLGTRGNSQYCYAGMRSRSSLYRPQLYTDYSEENDIKIREDTASSVAKEEVKLNMDDELVNMKHELFVSTHYESFPSADCYLSNPCREKQMSSCPIREQPCENNFNSGNDSATDEVERSIQSQKLTDYPENLQKNVHGDIGDSVDHFNIFDSQIEEELAQYFQDEDAENFTQPRKMYSATSRYSSNPVLYRSLSCSGVGFENRKQYSQNRCNSTVEFDRSSACSGGSRQVQSSADCFKEDTHSSCASATNPSDSNNYPHLQNLLVRPASDHTGNCNGNDNNFRFTPIPLAPRPCSRKNSFAVPHHWNGSRGINLRPRSYSTTGVKCGFKRNFSSAFVKPKLRVTPTLSSVGTVIKTPIPYSRSQSLPYFLDNSSINQCIDPSLANEDVSNTLTNSFSNLTDDELTNVFENSISKTDPILFHCPKIRDGLLENASESTPNSMYQGPPHKPMETDEIDSKDDSVVKEPPSEGDLLSEMFAMWPEPSLHSGMENFPAINENPVF